MLSWPAHRAVRVDVDVALVSALLALGLFEAAFAAPDAPSWRQAGLTFAWSLPLLWRRRHPVPVLALVVVLGPVLGLVNPLGGVNSYVLAAVLVAYAVGRELDAPASWWGPSLILGINWTLFAVGGGQMSDFVFIALIYGGAWAVGQAIRVREQRVSELALTTERLREDQQAAAIELSRERARIARELHDIVAHSISVVAIQTQAIRRRLGPDNAREIEDLRALEETARGAMIELRRMLGVLRADDSVAALQPQPGIGQLPQLAAEARAAGTPVETRIDPGLGALSEGVELAVYRVVQEALTNVRKHAPGAAASVSLERVVDELVLRIENDGSADDPHPVPRGGGHGLVGMRERVGLYGGVMTAGPRADGGYAVVVRLPASRPHWTPA
jgi:signal transduction histidine kinase